MRPLPCDRSAASRPLPCPPRDGAPPPQNRSARRRRARGVHPLRSVLVRAALFVAILAPAARTAETPPAAERPVDPARLARAIDRAGAYLVGQCGEDGRFVYVRYLDGRTVDPDRYNMLRHAGTLYALALIQARAPDPGRLAAMRRAGAYLRRQISGPVPGAPETSLAVWRTPEVVGGDPHAPPYAKLGGAGLGLVALSSLHRHAPGAAPRETLRGLAAFILFLQKPDGGFYSRYFLDGGRDDSWTSLYYPGEAMLGLLLLDDIEPDDRRLAAAARAMGFLARSRAGKTKVPADHWALLATGPLLEKLDRLDDPPVTRAAVLAHARQILRRMVGAQLGDDAPAALRGGFGPDGRTCPAATRLEGLTEALAFLPPEDAALRARVRAAADRTVRFLLDAQTTDGPMAGAIPRHAPAAAAFQAAGERAAVTDARVARAFPRAAEVRIDYVQHAVCGFLQYERTVLGGPPGDAKALDD